MNKLKIKSTGDPTKDALVKKLIKLAQHAEKINERMVESMLYVVAGALLGGDVYPLAIHMAEFAQKCIDEAKTDDASNESIEKLFATEDLGPKYKNTLPTGKRKKKK